MTRRTLTLLGLSGILIASTDLLTAQALGPAKPSDLVVLVTDTGKPCVGVPDAHPVNFRSLPNATYPAFKIPDGQVLVVTGVNFSVSSSAENRVKRLSLFAKKDPSTVAVVLFRTVVLTTETSLGLHGGGSATIPNAVVKQGFDVCVSASEINGAPTDANAMVYGFLTKDQ
jgi:hypothetical protein